MLLNGRQPVDPVVVFEPIADRKALLHDGKPIVTAAQLMQCAGGQPKPVGGLLGGN
jgi:hypothetical protein